MLRSGARVTSTREAVDFELDLPDVADMPGYMKDTIAMIRSGLIGGISPGFRVPPKGVVPNGERLEPEPGNPAVQVRVIENAVLSELSIVTRPAYSAKPILTFGRLKRSRPGGSACGYKSHASSTVGGDPAR